MPGATETHSHLSAWSGLFAIDERNRKWWTLGAVAFALFMIMLDNTIVNVASPSIGRGLGVGVSELEWVVNGYTLSFAVFMLTGASRSTSQPDTSSRANEDTPCSSTARTPTSCRL
jgi:hypothetical protein